MSVALFADLFDLDKVYLGIRVVATFIGVIIGWYVTAPLAAIVYRLIVRAAMPGWSMAFTRMAGSVLAGFLVFNFLHFGGNGGLGWGAGNGGGAGAGPGSGGTGTGNGVAAAPKDLKSNDQKPAAAPANADAKDVLSIEILGGTRYTGEGKYYLLDRKEPPVKLADVDAYLKANPKKYTKVQLVVTGDSVVESHPAFMGLRKLTEETYKLPTMEVR